MFSKDVKENEGLWELQNYLVKGFVFSFLTSHQLQESFHFPFVVFFSFLCVVFFVTSMTKWLCDEITQVYNLWPLKISSLSSVAPFNVFGHFSLAIPCFLTCDLNLKSMWKNACVKSKLKQEVTSYKPYLLSPNIWPSLSFVFLVFHLSPILIVTLPYVLNG